MFELSLINSHDEAVYDSVTIFASKVIRTDIAFISTIAPDYHYFKSTVGLPNSWNAQRRLSLSDSICLHVVEHNQALIISDAQRHYLTRDNPFIYMTNINSYLGMPLTLDNGKSLGTLCVLNRLRRDWTTDEIAIMTELAAIVTKEFNARINIISKTISPKELAELQKRIIACMDSISPLQSRHKILQEIRQKRVEYQLI